MRLLLALLLCASGLVAQNRKVLVLSIDGLDHRYLRDADRPGLKIPNLRRLMREGEFAAGVIGVAPTMTWPSHTSMVTGVRPEDHGVLNNRKPREEGGDYYWSVSNLKVKTLWDSVRAAGKTSAAITWPVTVDAAIDYNLPEYFQRRNGGGMDQHSIASKATPGLMEMIARRYPAFPHEWMDDRSRALATMAIIQRHKPDLFLVHFVDLDSEAHEAGPFTPEANGILEYTDELIGGIVAMLPAEYSLVLVSDHGFERIDRTINIPLLLARDGIKEPVLAQGGVLAAPTPAGAEHLRKNLKNPDYGILREIPKAELQRFSPKLASMEAVFEPAPHTLFGSATQGEVVSKPREKGTHGFWPLRSDYRSIYLHWKRGGKPAQLPEMDMLSIAPRIAQLIGVAAPAPRVQ